MKGLEELKEVFRDDRVNLAIGKILTLHLAEDKSYLKAKVSIFPENREIIALVAWDSVGPNSGFFNFPAAEDMVLIAFAEGDEEQAFIIKRLTSKVDLIPENATTGDSVLKALNGKKTWISSDNRINLAKSTQEPTENLVLGQVFLTFMMDLLQIQIDMLTTLSAETHVGNLGFPTGVPTQAADYSQYKTAIEELMASPIEDEAILSDLTYTEK